MSAKGWLQGESDTKAVRKQGQVPEHMRVPTSATGIPSSEQHLSEISI